MGWGGVGWGWGVPSLIRSGRFVCGLLGFSFLCAALQLFELVFCLFLFTSPPLFFSFFVTAHKLVSLQVKVGPYLKTSVFGVF